MRDDPSTLLNLARELGGLRDGVSKLAAHVGPGTTWWIPTLTEAADVLTAQVPALLQAVDDLRAEHEVRVEQEIADRYTLGGVQDELWELRAGVAAARDDSAAAARTLDGQVLPMLYSAASLLVLVLLLSAWAACVRRPVATVVVDATPVATPRKAKGCEPV